jgi:DNA invertase Pin-like site-specific DNA recombinase
MVEMAGIGGLFEVTPFDGCGRCLVAVLRLSRVTDATSSPQRQAKQIKAETKAVGGHIIGVADDMEVSGAVNPLDRPKFGPWLRDEMGPYSGIVAASVDRIGRNLVDVLNTGYMMRDTGKLLVTYRHGVWDLSDTTEENQFTMEAWAAQMELRAIQKRNRDDTERARTSYEKKNRVSYGYRIVRLTPKGKIHSIELDPHSSKIRREIAARILADQDGQVTPHTEAARLNRTGEPSPADHERMAYGRGQKGNPWRARSILDLMISETALGYLMHNDRPVTREVIDPQSGEKRLEKVRIAPPLWDAGTRAALVAKLAPKKQYYRAPKAGGQLMTARAVCGNCGQRLYLSGRTAGGMRWGCSGRINGLPQSARCKPAPSIGVAVLDAMVTEYFLENFGGTRQYRQVFDPGTGHAARRAELETDLTRLREDRNAGLYDRPADAQWYRAEYRRLGEELDALNAQPEREAGMVWVPTGKTMGELWTQAPGDAERRELLASYNVKAVIFPRGREQRVWIHSLDPAVEADAREQSWQRAQEEQDAAFFARLQAEQESEPDWDDYDAQLDAEAAARDEADQEAAPQPDDDAPVIYHPEYA